MKSKQKNFYINVNVHTAEGEMSTEIQITYEKGKLTFDENISLQLLTEGWITIKNTEDVIRERQMQLENRNR